MIGMPPATLASKAIGLAVASAGVEDLGAVRGQQRLVGGDDVLAGRQQIEHGPPGPVDAADHLDDDLHRRVVDHAAQIGGEQLPGNARIAGLVRSRTTTRRSSSGRPARAASRSGCSSSSFATPLPTVPQPIRAMP